MILKSLIDGGPLFTFPIVILFILNAVLLVRQLSGKGDRQKTISLLSSLGLFAVVWGFLGQILGLVGAFNSMQQWEAVSVSILSAGLAISFIAPIYGLVTFLIARLGIIVLQWNKEA